MRDLDDAEEQRAAFRRSLSVEQPMPRPRRLGVSGGKPITQVSSFENYFSPLCHECHDS